MTPYAPQGPVGLVNVPGANPVSGPNRYVADTERTTIELVPTKLKEIRVDVSGTYRVSFDYTQTLDTPGLSMSAQVYKNGAGAGAAQGMDTNVYATFAENIVVVAGDLLQLYVMASAAGNAAKCRNFRIAGDYGSVVID